MSHDAKIHTLLDRLEKVKQTRSDSWIACCPAHDDKNPSLNIRLADDGKVLLKCWCGCGALDIVTAVGMELSDLFPKRDEWSKPIAAGQRWIGRDILTSLAQEAMIVSLAASELSKGTALSSEDMKRLSVASGRLRAAAQEVR